MGRPVVSSTTSAPPRRPTNPPFAGCVAMVRVTRLTASAAAGRLAGRWFRAASTSCSPSGCFQFASHASGDVVFGPDGKLYASAGDGASFDTEDYGQYANPCLGTPANEGGSLRSQDYRTARGPVGGRRHGDADRPGQRDSRPRRPPRGSGWSPTGSATRGGSPSGRGRPSSGPATWAAATGRRSTGCPMRPRRVRRSTAAGPATRAPAPGRSATRAGTLLDRPMCENLYAAGLGAVQAPYFSYRTREAPGRSLPARTASSARRRSPAWRSRRPPATTRPATRARCSSPTSPGVHLAAREEAER